MCEMIDSGIEWIGKIPQKWELKRIQFCLQEINEKNSPIKTNQILSLVKNKGVMLYEDKGNQGNKAKEDLSQYKIAYPNTLIVNSMNILIGSVGISNYIGCVSPVYYVFKETENSDLRYINYIFNTKEFQSELRKYANGILEIRLRVSASDIFKRKIPFPHKTIQITIADFLDEKCAEIDNLASDIEKQIEILEGYKKSIITEIVTKGLDPDVELKDSGIEWIGKIPKDWECMKIKYVATLSRGIFGHRPRNDPKYYDGKYSFIQTGDVACATKVITNYSQTLNEFGKNVSKAFKKGTIAFTLAANVGDVSILGFDAYFPDSIMAIIPYKEIDNVYMYYILSIMKSEFLRAAIINTQLNLNVERVGNLCIPITFNEIEQKRIVEYLDEKCTEIDGAIEDKKEQVKILERYKKTLIYEYVTGKKEVE